MELLNLVLESMIMIFVYTFGTVGIVLWFYLCTLMRFWFADNDVASMGEVKVFINSQLEIKDLGEAS